MIRRGRDAQTANGAPADLVAAVRLQFFVQVHRVLAHSHQRWRRVKNGDDACRMPRRAARELPFVEQNDVVPTGLREMISDAATGNSAADDDDAR